MVAIRVRRAAARASAGVLLGAVIALAALGPGRASADDPVELSFVGGGAFFSQTQKTERAIDPQVFVYDPLAAVGTGAQRIEHIAGLRNARLDDAPLSPAYNAQGLPLGLSLRKWLSARGTLEAQTQADGRTRLIASFKHLVPFGTYSLFAENISPGGERTARPLDADGSASSFEARADGSAMIVLDTALQLTAENAVVLVYHSDGRDHGVSRGQLGVTAHEQLVAHL